MLLVLIHYWKNISIDFVIGLVLFINSKSNSYILILIIDNHLTKIINYKPIKVTINISRLTKVIIDIIMQYPSLSNSIICDCGAIFIIKFWSLLYYFFNIKKQLSTIFHPQTDDQIEWQNSIMATYFCFFSKLKIKQLDIAFTNNKICL